MYEYVLLVIYKKKIGCKTENVIKRIYLVGFCLFLRLTFVLFIIQLFVIIIIVIFYPYSFCNMSKFIFIRLFICLVKFLILENNLKTANGIAMIQ